VVVIHHQHAHIGLITMPGFGSNDGADLLFQLGGKPKGGPLSWIALHPIWPCMIATSCLEIAKPNPVPPYLRVVDPSAWL
jgi:hypothetical protein